MGAETSIEWAHWPTTEKGGTWNPVAAFLKDYYRAPDGRLFSKGTRGWHCNHFGDDCLACYAEGTNLRRGTGLPYLPISNDLVDLRLVNLDMPLRKQATYTWFVNSMSDLFLPQIPFEWVAAIFGVMLLRPDSIFLSLTKNPKRAVEFLEWLTHDARQHGQYGGGALAKVCWKYLQECLPEALNRIGLPVAVDWPPKHVHFGVTIGYQQAANGRGKYLRQIHDLGWQTWVSYEPAIGPVDWQPLWPEIGWFVIGGESRQKHTSICRPFNVDWASNAIYSPYRPKNVRVFVKQLGADPREGPDNTPLKLAKMDSHNKDISLWPEWLRVREFPIVQDQEAS